MTVYLDCELRRVYVLTYIDGKANIRTLTLYNQKDVDSWIEKLDARIARGTCGGYDLVEVNANPHNFL